MGSMISDMYLHGWLRGASAAFNAFCLMSNAKTFDANDKN